MARWRRDPRPSRAVFDPADLLRGVTAGAITTNSVTVLDNNTAGLVFDPDSVVEEPEGNGSYTVALSIEPPAM